MVPIAEFPTYMIDRQGYITNRWGRVMKQRIGTSGYCVVPLRVRGHQYQRLLHRLLAIAFIPNPEGKTCINHKNGIKTDNRIENLEWCTYSENATHSVAVLSRRTQHGEAHYASKLTDAQVCEIKKMLAIPGAYIRGIANEYGVSKTTIARIKTGQTRNHVTLQQL